MNYHIRLIILSLVFLNFCAKLKAQDSIQKATILQRLDSSGITFGINETLEGHNNFKGGIKTGTAYASTFDANFHLDLQRLINLKGGSFYADFEYHSGNNPTEKLTGDFQVFDKHNSFPFAQMLELWYQQKLFDNKLRLKIGKIDANSEFSVIDNGLEFINSSTQVTPTFFTFTTFPDPVPSINIFFTPGKLFYTNFAIDDANQNAKFLNFYGDPVSVQPTKNGVLLLSESGLTWNHFWGKGKDGNFKLGFWYHTGTFPKFDGTTLQTTQGLYLIFNQTLWQPDFKNNPARGIRMFLEFGLANASVAPVYVHYGGGLVWTGLSPGRKDDAIGISAHYVRLSPNLNLNKQGETNMETFYKVIITNWVYIKADVQYIINPGGIYNNALVGILLLNFNLGT